MWIYTFRHDGFGICRDGRFYWSSWVQQPIRPRPCARFLFPFRVERLLNGSLDRKKKNSSRHPRSIAESNQYASLITPHQDEFIALLPWMAWKHQFQHQNWWGNRPSRRETGRLLCLLSLLTNKLGKPNEQFLSRDLTFNIGLVSVSGKIANLHLKGSRSLNNQLPVSSAMKIKNASSSSCLKNVWKHD